MDESGSDDVLRLVLERVDSHVSLIRAATVCRRWRSIIADAAFLRSYRSLHAPAVAGEFNDRDWRSDNGPVFVPSSPSVVDTRHFSLDFLPHGAGSWILLDSRGSLLLLVDSRRLRPGFLDMVVCEPLTRRFEIVPPPSAEHTIEGCSHLIDGIAIEAGGCISMSNFRVLCMFHYGGAMYTAMFTVGSSWGEKNICHAVPNLYSTNILGRAGGKLYFCVEGRALVDLDCSTGDFTSSVFPAIEDLDFDTERCNFFVTELQDGKPRIITVSYNTLKVFARLDSGEWSLEKGVLLQEATRDLPGYKCSFFHFDQGILTRGKGYVILSPQSGVRWLYSVNLETMEAKPAKCDMGPMVYRCELPWPPALHAHL